MAVTERGLNNDDAMDDGVETSYAGLGSIDDDDEANQGNTDSASALTRSELDMWEAARNVEAAGNQAVMLEPDQSELTEDTVRMYLREIGRVALLTADDEVVLARAVELAQWLTQIENEIRGEEARTKCLRSPRKL